MPSGSCAATRTRPGWQRIQLLSPKTRPARESERRAMIARCGIECRAREGQCTREGQDIKPIAEGERESVNFAVPKNCLFVSKLHVVVQALQVANQHIVSSRTSCSLPPPPTVTSSSSLCRHPPRSALHPLLLHAPRQQLVARGHRRLLVLVFLGGAVHADGLEVGLGVVAPAAGGRGGRAGGQGRQEKVASVGTEANEKKS